MIKIVFFLKRSTDLTREEFRKLYESRHARLGEKHVPNAARYVRRYLEPVPELFTGTMFEPEHDVITELWFDDRAAYEQAMANLARPEVVAEIVADEETIFDRSKHRLFMVEECDSPVGAER
ncbi:EthD domain-containing protein [Tsuneonella sp. CC-YZS046]|uniref:EthD domain-containing protein n=1 Tax=Tsuneonella sp. CC-YZS046 TaxID=3042152 RepID=UPI002D792F78|nr:EthD domain-containing protein [Tsuneonella sp. CC-YZS046]WRO65332.1 EthD domain-containing protein [Tsuneonella sp. CC-YZS046]